MARSPRQNRRGGRRGKGLAAADPAPPDVVRPGLAGGGFRPLSGPDLEAVHRAALHILERIGLSDAPASLTERAVAAGASVTDAGRLCFSGSLVEDAIAGFRRNLVLHGSRPGHELALSRNRVHVGTGGAAPNLVDIRTGTYRPSTLRDLYDAARLADALENVHFFSRSLVARDMPTPRDLDINTAYACLAGTGKHVMVSASEAAHVEPIARICATVAGGAAAFADRPFLSLNVNHVVPPLRFVPEACAVLEAAALRGIPVFVNSFDQAGASSPASLAGSLAQSVAETLAGMIMVRLVNPDCPAIFGPRPLITDLRTGAMTGGCGEQAILMAGAVQMASHYDLPNSCIAGATDSKEPDAQSGYEKALSVSLAAHAGCTMITQAGGMHAALMGVALESYVIDNDMLGDILRSVRGDRGERGESGAGDHRRRCVGRGTFPWRAGYLRADADGLSLSGVGGPALSRRMGKCGQTVLPRTRRRPHAGNP